MFFSHNYANIEVDSYDSLPKSLTFHNVIIHMNLVWNKDENHYYYNIFLEKRFQLPKNNNNK